MSLRDRLNRSKSPAKMATGQVQQPQAAQQSGVPSSSVPAVTTKIQVKKSAAFQKGQRFNELKSRIHNRLVEGMATGAFEEMSEQEVGLAALQLLEKMLAEEDIPMGYSEREVLVQELIEEILGFGPIEPLLHEEDISEIMINGPQRVFVERYGKLELTDIQFKDDAHLMHVIERIVSLVGRRVDEKTPMVDARLKAPGKPYDGSRFNAIIPPLAIDGPSVTIRKFKQDAGTLDKLLGWGSMTPEMAEVLKAAIKCHLNIVISGGTGSGKTTMLNSLSALIENTERIVTIEDAAELQLQQPHVVRLESRPANIEGEGSIPIRKLLMNSLRMRPDRIIVGECRGGETLDMLQAMNTGHDGSLTTLHANSPRDALARIQTMCLMNDNPLPEKAIRQQISSAVHLIVQVSRLSDGQRKTTSITEITGIEEDTVVMQEIFRFEQTGVDSEWNVIGRHVATGIRPRFAEVCESKGVQLPPNIFDVKRPEEASNLGTSKGFESGAAEPVMQQRLNAPLPPVGQDPSSASSIFRQRFKQ